jgi:hypothetical protein
MQNDAAQEWQRLTSLYAEKSDEELLELAADFGNLTETAQQVLRDEMRKRRLETPQALAAKPAEDARQLVFGQWNRAAAEQKPDDATEDFRNDGGDEPRDYTWRTLLCECEDNDRAFLLSQSLTEAGIENWVEYSNADPLGLPRLPRILVPADELEKASEIALRPIPQDIIDFSKTPVEDFVPPSCPKCGSPDSLLVTAEPTNTWGCDNCGAQWGDPVEGADGTVQNRDPKASP